MAIEDMILRLTQALEGLSMEQYNKIVQDPINPATKLQRRERIATAVLGGYLAPVGDALPPRQVAKMALAYADALIKELDRDPFEPEDDDAN